MAKKKSMRKTTAARKPAAKKPATGKPTANKARTGTSAAGSVTSKKRTAKKVAPKLPTATTRLATRKSVPTPTKARPGDGPPWPREGAKAPDFTAVAHDGSRVTLSALAGRPVVLYFYPKDDTPGCTVEACGFRDAHPRFGRHKAVVLGVSPDSPRSHVKFREKFGLPFTLLADENHALAEKYGAWREKSMYGRTYMGVARSTFVIDAAGRIAKVFTSVKPEGHEREVLAAIAGLR